MTFYLVDIDKRLSELYDEHDKHEAGISWNDGDCDCELLIEELERMKRDSKRFTVGKI